MDFRKEARLYQKEYLKVFKTVLLSGWYILGKEVQKFEENFAKYLGVKYALGVGNGLEALQISLLALGISKDDEVITTPISAAATTLAILLIGAKPVFVDTDESGLINPDLIPEAITKKTKAILPVHLYGNSSKLMALKKIAAIHGLYLIEDAAQAHGSEYLGKKLGSFGDTGCFSFYPTKNLGAFGDGGAIVTNNPKLYKICHQLRDYGQKDKYIHTLAGLNSRLDELQAAILSFKLKKLDGENQKRRILAKTYIKNLEGKVGIVIPSEESLPNYHQFVIKTRHRGKLQKLLFKKGVKTLIHYPKIIPDQPFLKAHLGGLELPIARKFVKECLSLPMHPYLSLNKIDQICYLIPKRWGR